MNLLKNPLLKVQDMLQANKNENKYTHNFDRKQRNSQRQSTALAGRIFGAQKNCAGVRWVQMTNSRI